MKIKIVTATMLLCATQIIHAENFDRNAICYLSSLVVAANQSDVERNIVLKSESEFFLNYFLNQKGNTRQNFYDELLKIKPVMTNMKWDEVLAVQKNCDALQKTESYPEKIENNVNQHKSKQRIPMSEKELLDVINQLKKHLNMSTEANDRFDKKRACSHLEKALKLFYTIDERDVPNEVKLPFYELVESVKIAAIAFKKDCNTPTETESYPENNVNTTPPQATFGLPKYNHDGGDWVYHSPGEVRNKRTGVIDFAY